VLLPARWLDVSLILFFWQLKGQQVTGREFDKLQCLGLLNPSERFFLERYSIEQVILILLHWSAQVAVLGTAEAKTPPSVNQGLLSALVKCHHLELSLVDAMELPIPFQYFHLLSVMITINLLLWAYCMGCASSYFAPVVYYFATLIFVGMMDLASQLSNHFGDDEVDFPLEEWMTTMFSEQHAVLRHEYPEETKDIAKKWKDLIENEEGTFTWDPSNFDGIQPSTYFTRLPQGSFSEMGPAVTDEPSQSTLSAPSDAEKSLLLGSRRQQKKWVV